MSQRRRKMSSSRILPANDGYRTFELGNPASGFCDNRISTAKYNPLWLMIWPKSLWEQLRRAANFYFLVISALQLFTPFSPTSKFATAGPLSVVLMVTLVKEFFEDKKRHTADARVNFSKTRVLKDGVMAEKLWKDLLVGDIVELHDREEIPADLLLLASSDEDGLVYMETSNLDGETNLKIRQALDETQSLVGSVESAAGLRGKIDYELPNNKLYHFDGVLQLEGEGEVPIGINNILLRGAAIRNIKRVFGVVVFAGYDTKLMRNTKSAPSKRSRIEVQVDRNIFMVFSLMLALSVFSTIYSARDASSLCKLSESTGIGNMTVVPSGNDFLRVYDASISQLYKMHVDNDGPSIENACNYEWYDAYPTLRMQWAPMFITFVMLFNNFVPISLYVTIEIVKILQAREMENDPRMHYEKTGTSMLARTSNLNEDLGQVEYLFSDKTGTLTCNEMEFRKCSVAGTVYGFMTEKDILSYGEKAANTNPIPPSWLGEGDGAPPAPLAEPSVAESKQDSCVYEPRSDFNFTDPRLMERVRRTDGSEKRLREFLTCLAVCHTVLPDSSGEASPSNGARSPSETVYQASSPDEGALVIAASCFGFKFISRTAKTMTIEVMGDQQTYEVLAVNEFNSTRKRMSVLVRTPEGKAILYCKGADNVIFERAVWGQTTLSPRLRADSAESREAQTSLGEDIVGRHGANISVTAEDNIDFEVMHRSVAAESRQEESMLNEQLMAFASSGLRTLVLARRELDDEECARWLRKYDDASSSLQNRDTLRDEAAEEVELKLRVLGATAIEDKLQEDVPETIERLSQAGIKLWVLTGDKVETAINIGHSCNLLNENMQILVLGEEDGNGVRGIMHDICKQLEQRKEWNPKKVNKSLALVVDGAALHELLSGTNVFAARCRDRTALKFLELCRQCRSVIACRVSPLQKALMVTLVKKNVPGKPMTLAIGDGANDVGMIQQAHIGVGISGGHEGMQAVQASDYAISRFCFLQPLLLDHGRSNYRRVSLVVLYSFYKNVLHVFTLFFFQQLVDWTGTTEFESWVGVGWNVFFTFFPIILVGVFDFDLSYEAILRCPAVYKSGHGNSEFNGSKMLLWMFWGFMHSALIYLLFTVLIVSTSSDKGVVGGEFGRVGDCIFVMGTYAYAWNINLANAMLLISAKNWSYRVVVSICASVLIYFPFVMIMGEIYGFAGAFSDMYKVGTKLYALASFWFSLPLALVVGVVFNVLKLMYERDQNPTPANIIEEYDRGTAPWPSEETMKHVMSGRKAGSVLPGTERVLPMMGPMVHGKTSMNRSRTSGFAFSSPTLEHSIPNGTNASTSFDRIQMELLHLQQELSATAGLGHARKGGFVENMEEDLSTNPYSLQFENPDLEEEYMGLFLRKAIDTLKNPLIFMGTIGIFVLPHIQVEPHVLFVRMLLAVLMLICGILFKFAGRCGFDPTPIYMKLMKGVVPLVQLTITLTIDTAGRGGIVIKILFVMYFVPLPITYRLYFCLFDVFFWIAFSLITQDTIINELIVNQVNEDNQAVHFIFFVILLLLVIAILYQGASRSEAAERDTFIEQRKLRSSKAKSDQILASMLPQHVVKRLKKNPNAVIADAEPELTVLFCDLEHFTGLLRGLSATQFVRLLDSIYSLFDEVCNKHGMHKMETVGKTYMACAGLQRSSTDHARAAVDMGLEMIALISKCSAATKKPISVRVGINTTSPNVTCVSGMVGTTKPQFCLFGDVVNTAARMQSTGQSNRVHISEWTHKHIKDEFIFEQREVSAKGKGKLTTYLVGNPLCKRGCVGSALAGPGRELVTHGGGMKNGSSKGFGGGRAPQTDQPQGERLRAVRKSIGSVGGSFVYGLKEHNEEDEDIAELKMNPLTLSYLGEHENLEEEFQTSEFQNRVIKGRVTIIIVVVFSIFDIIHWQIAAFRYSPSNDESNSTCEDRGMARNPTTQNFYVEQPELMHTIFIALSALVFLISYNTRIYQNSIFGLSKRWLHKNVLTVLFLLGGLTLTITFSHLGDTFNEALRKVSRCSEDTDGGITCAAENNETECVLLVPDGYYDWNGHLQDKLWMYFSTTQDWIMVLNIIFMSVACNGGALNFVRSGLINTGTLMLTIVVAMSTDLKLAMLKFYAFLLFAWLLNLFTASRRETYLRQTFYLKNEMKKSTAQNKTMMYKMLPKAVVERISDGNGNEVDEFKNVSLLFADIVGFTRMSASTTPDKVVHILFDLFKEFDELTAKNNVFKLQTIGDCYVIVSGVPYSNYVPNSASNVPGKGEQTVADHTRDLLRMASDMLRTIEKISQNLPPGVPSPLQMRIGIHTGDVVGGVIGNRALRYDMWGDDVLIANQMESRGVPGRVVVSEDTKRHMEGCKGYKFEPHQSIQLKAGQGVMDTYLVTFEKP